MALVELVAHGDWVEVVFNRPEKRNALSPQLVAETTAVVREIAGQQEVKVVVFGGRGKVFSAGADLAYLQELSQYSDEENRNDVAALSELFERIYHLPQITLARVQGAALAGGCGLITLMDFVVAAEDARFGYTEARIGFVPALVANYLIRKVPGSVATDLLLSARLLSAAEAQQLGLVNRVVPADRLEEEVTAFVTQLLEQNSAQAMQLTKQLLRRIMELPLKEGLAVAADINVAARKTADCQKGVAAFLNKETIRWRESRDQ